MKSWRIPVTWEVCSTIWIEADTLEEAMEIAKDEAEEIPLPDDGNYVDGSWPLSDEDIESVRELYNNNQQDEKDEPLRFEHELVGIWVDSLLKESGKQSLKDLTECELRSEIEDVEGTIRNERLWAKTATVHEDNIKVLKEYLGLLKSLLYQIVGPV